MALTSSCAKIVFICVLTSFLQTAIIHRPGRSFQNLRTFNSHVFPTFHEAAIHLGLFTSIDEGHYAMEEATSSYIPPSQLRFLFSRIILEGYPARPLWESFKDFMAIDFVHSLHSTERGIDYTLQQIEEYVQDGGCRLQDFGLPSPLFRSPEIINELEAFANHLPTLQHHASNALSTMNFEQHSLFSMIYTNIINNTYETPCPPIFVEGRPGRGKTFLMNAIVNKLRSQGKIVLIVGTSALAASLYERGRTAHSLFEIPVTDVCFNVKFTIHDD